MKTRVITGIALAGLLIPLFLIGGWFLYGMLLVLSMVATYEFFQLYNATEKLPMWVGAVYVLYSGVLFHFLAMYFTGDLALEWAFLALVDLLIGISLLLVFVPSFGGHRAGEMLFSILYPAFGFAAIYFFSEDVYAIGFVFLITVATDIFAYIVGINFGKHRLAVNISPKKSIEGSIGGTLAAMILVVIYVLVVDLEVIGSIALNIGPTIGLVFVLSIIGQIGDLVASKIKRQMGIKDFSNIFPGHGGIMDRFDSVLLVGIVVLFISLLVDML